MIEVASMDDVFHEQIRQTHDQNLTKPSDPISRLQYLPQKVHLTLSRFLATTFAFLTL